MLHINVLEFQAVRLGLCLFAEFVQGSVGAVFSDKSTALIFLDKEGSTHSSVLYTEAQEILDRAKTHSVL